ncbi:MAG: pyrroline-5-carboxylate reductase [Deltaproteobacteria bacterium]|jgi:pyrroline-5-carboxylate reductase|nr:pyrroline-5-carboxylate reductase [Deltaproteobacteria bacterium]
METRGEEGFGVAFLGYGRMAQAISRGLDRHGLVPYARQAAYDVLGDNLARLSAQRGFKAAAGGRDLAGLSPTIIVAVKPHQVRGALEEIRPALSDQLVISIAAGVTLGTLASLLPSGAGLVRVIPNLPALVGQGMTLICVPDGSPPASLDKAKAIFGAVGSVAVLAEDHFNEGTAVSGSGPAYFFLVMEAMIRGAVRLGLTWDVARELVLKTALGSAQAAIDLPDLSLAELRDQVTSPGGTTAEGLLELEKGSITAVIHQALKAASDKGSKLA